MDHLYPLRVLIQVGHQMWEKRSCTYLSCPRRTLFRSSFTCINSTITSSFSTVTNNSMILSCITRQVLYSFCPREGKKKNHNCGLLICQFWRRMIRQSSAADSQVTSLNSYKPHIPRVANSVIFMSLISAEPGWQQLPSLPALLALWSPYLWPSFLKIHLSLKSKFQIAK